MGTSGSSTAGSSAGAGVYQVPNRDRCSDGPGEVLMVDVWSAALALDDSFLYVLASSSADAPSLELSRIPLAGGAPERLASQSLYGFGLGVRDGAVWWLARPELLVLLDEDYVDWNVWTLASADAQPSVVIQDGVRHLSVGPRGLAYSRIDPLMIQLDQGGSSSNVCAAAGVTGLASNADVAVWSQYDSLYTCSFDDGAELELAPGEEKRPDRVLADSEYAYWGSEGDPGVWRAPLAGGAAEAIVPDVESTSLALAGRQLYFVRSELAVGSEVQRVNLDSLAIDSVVGEGQGNIRTLAANDTHVYWQEYNSNQFFCLKRIEAP